MVLAQGGPACDTIPRGADMLDLHNHVIFGLDDGCRSIEESAALAEAAKSAGHRGFVATPHIRKGMFENTPDTIRARRDETRPIVEKIGLELHLGAEYYFDEEILFGAREKRLLTLGETSRFVLTELPQQRIPPRFRETLFEIRLKGYVPVIAHPERCRGVQDDLEAAYETFQQSGVLLQLDLGSLIGHYGRPAKVTGTDLVKRGAYHVAACDLHRPEDVKTIVAPALAELRALLKKRKKEQELATLTDTNPRRIIANAPLQEICAV
jgi:protein-tyrosine phosphatase